MARTFLEPLCQDRCRVHAIPELRIDDLVASVHADLCRAFREPRIHFAIVCASKSCPILRAEAFRADEIEAQLEDAGRAFLADERRNLYHPDSNTLYLSAIFDWFVAVPARYRRCIGRSKISGTLRGTLGASAKILGRLAWLGP